MPPRTIPAIYRFLAWIDRDNNGCWLWTGFIKQNGYVTFHPGPGRGVPRVYTHRWSYEYFIGPVPKGLEIDHLCRVRHCVNPLHLEPVTPSENIRRSPDHISKRRAAQTTCQNGHPFDRFYASGRRCSICMKARA